MTPAPRTPLLRDRRFARVRRLAATLLVGSGLSSALMVGYFAATTHPVTASAPAVTAPATTVGLTSSTSAPLGYGDDGYGSGDDGATGVVTAASSSSASAAAATTATTAPTKAATTCYTTPSGKTVCV
jgi:hypothetical protein